MVLSVPLEGFVEACDQLQLPRSAWIARIGGRVRVTAVDSGLNVLVRCESARPLDSVRERLESAGFACRDGLWSSEAESEAVPSTSYYVAAVAYVSEEERPGVWVDATVHRPSEGEVVARMYEEFRSAGEAPEMELDAFIKGVKASVVVLSPEEQDQFASRNAAC